MSVTTGAAAWINSNARSQTRAAGEPDDELLALTRDARLGSEAAFSALFERFQTPIVNYINRLVDDWDMANDLAQDTFLKAYSALPRTDDGLQISPWLYRIATNTALDALRRRKRITWLPFTAEIEPRSPYPDPATGHAEGDAISKALVQVPADQRVCLVLNMYQGLSYKEIAEMLGISVNLVAVRIYRGREKFIEAYKKANPSD
ncbi:MAG: RNA polymerase sigma factor [Chloroflexota bacterium]|nr:RNA polymerase sigma factor [Chloroflexota bacterium]